MAATIFSSPATALPVLSDERLARLAARGDERAANALFARHQPGLTRYCRTILKHGADAEDAAQNALVAAHRALADGTVPMRVKPWLYKIAHNEAIDLVRTRRPAEELDEAQLPAAAGVEEAGEIRRRLGQLMTDLRALTERQREALVLRELCGLEYTEIAQTLGTSEGAAQQTVFEARSALQQFGEGRALDCEGVQRAMSDCDGMRLRTRKVRAHVRGCDRCRAFESSLRSRRRDLGLLFPPTGAAGGIVAALGRLFGEPALGLLGVKGAAVGLAVLAGGGTVVATSLGGDDRPAPRTAPALAAPAAATTAAPAASPDGEPAAAEPVRRRSGGGDASRRAPKRGDGTSAPATGPPDTPVSSDGTSVASAPVSGGGDGDSAQPRGGSDGGSGGDASQPATGSSPVRRPVQDTVGAVGQTVQDTTDAVGQVVQDTTDAVGETVQQTGDAVQDTVDQVTDTASDVVDGVTDAIGGLLGGGGN